MDWHPLFDRIYAPYSGMKDASIVRTSEGLLFPGVRIENASYPLTITGTQAAYASALSEGKTPVSKCSFLHREASSQFYETQIGLSSESEANMRASEKWFALSFHKPSDFRKALTDLLDFAKPEFSNFRVAALIGNPEDGFISGVNFETPLWSMGLCAERVAIAKAISNGFKSFSELHVITEKGSFCSPCGACRQVLNEINPEMHIHLHHPDGSHSRVFARDLLPYSFGLR